jgi:phosphatidylglycerophosphate synthase
VTRASVAPPGAKTRDYWWTVVVVDPLAVPLTRWLAARRLLSADQVTWLALVVALPMGPAYATGRTGLVVGAALFFVSFLLDCVDGKLARALGTSSSKGKLLDAVSDGGRRASGAAGLAVYLWRFPVFAGSFWLAVAYGLLAFYFAQISGTIREDPNRIGGGRWAQAMARRRMFPTPGTPDAAALVFCIGPLFGLVVPALIAGCAMFAVAVGLTILKLLRRVNE